MYYNTHFNNKNNFEIFVRNAFPRNVEDRHPMGGFSVKRMYNQCMATPLVPQESQPNVSELRETSQGVWECDINIPLNSDTVPNSDLKSIYRNVNKFSKCGFGTINSDKDISNAETEVEEEDIPVPEKVPHQGPNQFFNPRGNLPNFPGGKFIPVFGYKGCNFPPDYRLVNSRAGPQHRFIIPSANHKPAPPPYINNQFLRPTKLARWNSLEEDDVDNWDPFNLKRRAPNNSGFVPVPTNFTRQMSSKWVPNSAHPGRFPPFTRELMVYPNPRFPHNFSNQFNRYN